MKFLLITILGLFALLPAGAVQSDNYLAQTVQGESYPNSKNSKTQINRTSSLQKSPIQCHTPTPLPQPTPIEKEITEQELQAAIEEAMKERDETLSKPQIIYYSPVLNSTVDSIAYIKRTLDYRLKGGGLIPFLSASPEVTVLSDTVELCRLKLLSGAEEVVERWKIPILKDRNDVSYIAVELNWKNELTYNIHFALHDKIFINGGRYCKGSGFCISNTKDVGFFQKGMSETKRVKIALTEDPERSRYPTSNKIILECKDANLGCTCF